MIKDKSNGTGKRITQSQMNLAQALTYLVITLLTVVLGFTLLGVWIKLFWIGWVFAR